MTSILKTTASGILAFGLLAAFAATASAETERYGVTGITNSTSLTITYQIKVGDGNWTTYVIKPGQTRTFWHQYADVNNHKSPDLLIRFNSAVGSNRPSEIEYKLGRYAAKDKLYEFGKKYAFQKDDPNYYDLKSTN